MVMVDDTTLWSDLYNVPPQSSDKSTWGDVGRQIGAGAAEVGASLAASARYHTERTDSSLGVFTNEVSRIFQDHLNETGEDIRKGMTPAAIDRLSKNVTDSKFWEADTIGLQAAGMLPGVVAMAAGGVLGSLVGSPQFGVIAASSAQGEGDYLNTVYRFLDAKSDDDLKKTNPWYRQQRASMSEKDARVDLMEKVAANGAGINAVIGAVSGLVSPVNTVARGVAAGAAGRGLAARVGISAGENAAVEGVQEGALETTGQRAEMEIDPTREQEFDKTKIALAAAQGAVLGGGFGALGGIPSGKPRSARKPAADPVAEAPPADPAATPEVTQPTPAPADPVVSTAGPAPKGNTGSVPVRPNESAPVGDPNASPTRSETSYPKAPEGEKAKETSKRRGKKGAPVVETVPVVGPDVAQAGALAAKEPAPSPPPEGPPGVRPAPVPVQNEPPRPSTAAAALEAKRQYEAAGEPARPEVSPITPEQTPEQAARDARRQDALAAADQVPTTPPGPPAPVIEPKTGRRILEAIQTPEEKARDESLAKADEIKRAAEDSAAARRAAKQARSESGAKDRSHKGAEVVDKRVIDDAHTKEIFDAHPPVDTERGALDPRVSVSVPARKEVMARAKAAVSEAKKRGTKIFTQLKGENQQSAHTSWLSEAYGLTKVKGFTGKKADEAYHAFITRELEHRAGFTKEANADRFAEGEAAKGVKKGEAADQATKPEETSENIAEAKEAELERAVTGDVTKTDVTNVDVGSSNEIEARGVVKSRGGEVRGVFDEERAKEVAPVRKIELTPEQQAAKDALAKKRAEREAAKTKKLFGAPLPKEGLAPAHKYKDGTIAVGHRGSLHADIVDERYKGNPDRYADIQDIGFISPDGEYLAREQAIKWVEQNEGTKVKPGFGRSLDAKDYREQVVPKTAAAVAKSLAKSAPKKPAVPTPEQAKAGNYRKVHENIDGVEFTTETAKGQERKGVGADGKDWSVRMPYDYGYAKRTTGADGDHVDIARGPADPTKRPVVIIDQKDLKTGKFDEHKVHIGFDDVRHATEEYEKAYSDGKGIERIGGVKVLTWDEFKTWLKEGDTTKAVAKQDVDILALDSRSTGRQLVDNLAEGVNQQYATTAGELLKSLDFSGFKSVPKLLGPFIQRRLMEVIHGVKVYVVSPDVMHNASEAYFKEHGARPAAFYSPSYDAIWIDVGSLTDRNAAAHVVLHEAMHAAVHKYLAANKRAQEHVGLLMAEVRRFVELNPEHAKTMRYGLTNEHEFLSEAMSNPAFQDVLARIDMTPALARLLGLNTRRNLSLWNGVVNKVREWLGVPKDGYALIEGAMRVTEHLLDQRRRDMVAERTLRPVDSTGAMHDIHPLDAAALKKQVGEWAGTAHINVGARLRAIKNQLSTFRMLVDRAGDKLGPGAQRLLSAVARMHREASEILHAEGGLKLIQDVAKFARESPAEFARAAELMFDASTMRVALGKNADNSHFGKDKLDYVQSKARLPALQAEFDALSPRAQELLTRTAKFFSDMHDKMSLELIRNVLRAAGKDEPGLAERIHSIGLSEDEKKLFETNSPVLAIDEARSLKKVKGWYVPFRRYGEHLVTGKYDFATPAGATRIDESTVQFLNPKSNAQTRRDAKAFAAGSDLTHLSTKRVWVDVNDPTKIVDSTDVNAKIAYRVTLQTQHMSAYGDEAGARAALKELQVDADFKEGAVRLRRNALGRDSGGLIAGDLASVLHQLEKQERFKGMSATEQSSLRQALTEATIRATGSTRLTRRLQNRRVEGMSEDLGRVVAESAGQDARTLARLRFQPEIDKAFKSIDEHISANKYDKDSVKRDEFRNALDSFLHEKPSGPPTVTSKVVARLLQISRLDKLAGVSFHLVNAQEPWTTSLPVIAGRHGLAQTTRALAEAYNLIGARGGVAAGLKDTAKAFNADAGFTDYVARFQDNIRNSKALGPDRKARLIAALDHVKSRGLMSDEAIFEVTKHSDPSTGAPGRALDRADLMANQMGTAIEAINRSVTALAAADLEYRRTKNVELANNYARHTTEVTMGDYSQWNAPGFMKNHPIGQLAFQFKKFGFKTYYLLGKTLGGALRGDREAMKQFGGLMVTHAMVAGALGLPLEPFKVALMAAGWFGATSYSWEDVQNFIRAQAAGLLGKKGGEVFSHGLYRAVGVDVSSRIGLDSLMTGFSPKGTKIDDIKGYLFDTAAGAPTALLLDLFRATQAVRDGNYGKALELAIPIKAASDLIKAGNGLAGPTTNASGREKLPALSYGQAAIQALGFAPAARAEAGVRRATVQRQTAAQSKERITFETKWHMATPNERARMWGEIERWNRLRPKDAQLTRAQLESYSKSRGKELLKTQAGVKVTKQNKAFVDRAEAYNY
jgi:hypothetical protein